MREARGFRSGGQWVWGMGEDGKKRYMHPWSSSSVGVRDPEVEEDREGDGPGRSAHVDEREIQRTKTKCVRKRWVKPNSLGLGHV